MVTIHILGPVDTKYDDFENHVFLDRSSLTSRLMMQSDLYMMRYTHIYKRTKEEEEEARLCRHKRRNHIILNSSLKQRKKHTIATTTTQKNDYD